MQSSGAQGKNICFYSNSCRYSKSFLTELKDSPFKANFDFVCVDGRVSELMSKYKWLKRTPTVIIRGEDEPKEYNEAVNWLAMQKLLLQGKNQGGGVGGGGGGGDGSQGVVSEASEPEPWVGNEMGGSYTKGFSFIGANDTNEAPQGNFEFLNGGAAPGTKTASEYPGGGLGARAQNKSRKEDMFDKQMQAYMQERGSAVPPPPNRM
jgi:hypothetical protein